MRLYDNGFIGQEVPSNVSLWDSGDNLETFTANCEKMSPNWYYRNAKVIYKRNSNGHRCKEISELDLDNYILFLGCSHTEGIGLEEDKIYTHLLAKKLNCDYYSMGLGATGIDVVLHNLIVWFANVEKKPKLVVIQWPDLTRMLTGSHSTHFQPNGSWTGNEDYLRFINLGIDLEFFEARKLLTHALVKAVAKVPTVYFGLEKVIPFDDNTIIEKIVDRARDLGHPGLKSHENFANAIYDHLINNECLNFYQNTEQKS